MGQTILTPREMRLAEKALFDAGTDSFAVMQRAGASVAEFVHAHWPDGLIQVLCGPGGNGGDGFIAASLLVKRWRAVQVFCATPLGELTGDAANAAALWTGPVGRLEDALTARHELVLDALFGGGLTRPLSGVAAELAERPARVISVDVPSGLDGFTAKPLGPCFRAEATITFAALRPAHVLLPGSAYCGAVAVADIGVPVQSRAIENSPAIWAAELPNPGHGDYKHQRGHLKVVSGGMSSTGAARLAARAGLRAGAGLVTMLSPPSAMMTNAAHLTSIMLSSVDGSEQLLDAAMKSNVVIIGPAAGVTPQTRQNVSTLLKSPARLVLDADALTVFADEPSALFSQLREADVMTPHVGEFQRLFGDLLERAPNKIEAARQAAAQAGCLVLIKGADTVISSPSGHVVVNTHATRWLATAGSGDVLAGLIAGFMAQGVDTFLAAAMGAWIHGEAGRRVGPGLIAEDLEKQVPGILSALHGSTA